MHSFGDEEFAVLLKDKTAEETYEVAEQFKEKIASTTSPSEESIHISLGIATSSPEDRNRIHHSKSRRGIIPF